MADPVTPITSRVRDLCLESPCRTNRSVDSGYGSLETSPTRSPTKKRSDRASTSLAARLVTLGVNSYDGNSSEESEPESESDSSRDGDAEPEIEASPYPAREQFATLPRVSRRRISRTDSYPLLPGPQGTHQRYGSDNTGLQGSSNKSMRFLDRFVPLRNHVIPGSEKLQTSKPLDELTPSERLVRHNRDAPDPFCFKRKALPPSPTELRKARRSAQNRTTLDATSHRRVDRVVSQCAHFYKSLRSFLWPKRLISHACR